MKYKKWCKKMFELNSLIEAIAIDKFGFIYMYTKIPEIREISWKSLFPSTLIGTSTWKIDWKESLVLRDEEEPLKRWKPKFNSFYYIPCPTYDSLYAESAWRDDRYDRFRYNNNLIFKTQKEAISCSKKMLEASK